MPLPLRAGLLTGTAVIVLVSSAGALPGHRTPAAVPTTASIDCGRPEQPGTTTQTITVGSVKRTYLLVLPPGLPAGVKLPVVMGFHGGSDSAQNASRYMRLAAPEAAIYVYAQAPYWPEAGGVAWNVDPNGVDFPYFDRLLAHLRLHHCVDDARIFAAGMSNGGFMVNALACHRPGVLRAIASVAGGGPQAQCRAGVGAMIVHGTADRTVPIRSGRYSRDYWLARDGATSTATAPAGATCVRYPASPKPVQWCQHGGQHMWPDWAGAAIRTFFLQQKG